MIGLAAVYTRIGGDGGAWAVSRVAFLPMYVVRRAERHADTLWSCLRDSFRENGMDAPDHVARFGSRHDGWLHPELILGQTCGLPYITTLSERVVLVGTPDYGIDGCPAGFYHSTLVVSASDRRVQLSDFLGATVAINGMDSQSGYAAMMRAAAPFARAGRFFGRAIHSGSHAASMRLVAEGLADIAAIDSVTWRMSQLFDPDTVSGVRPIGTTDSVPGLPFIAAKDMSQARLFDAVQAGIAALPEDARQAFGLRGVLPFRRSDYDVIKDNLARAEAVHRLPELENLPTPGAGN